jgi:hypothetical protein
MGGNRSAGSVARSAIEPGARRAGAQQQRLMHDRINGMSRTKKHQATTDEDFEESVQAELARVRDRLAEIGFPEQDIDVGELLDRSTA